ncbi:MAG: sugar phosphate isomerase/epimerase [bacterium]|nr:sugar phosphate isomerase/epimerase [bacterium]
MDPRPLAVNLFSVRRELIADFEGTHARLAEMGYVGVEPMIFGPIPIELLPEDLRVPTPPAEEYRALLDRIGLEVASLHAPLPENRGPDQTGADDVLDFAEALGTDQLVLSSFMALPEAANAHADADLLDQAIDRFAVAADLAEARGIALGFHNHHFEWEVDLAGHFAWDLFWEKVDRRVRAEVDIYWAQTAGQDPVAVIDGLAARVRRIHFKDGPCVLAEPQVALGEGRVDIEACAAAAKYADWHIVELDECATDIFEALYKSARYLVDRGISRMGDTI